MTIRPRKLILPAVITAVVLLLVAKSALRSTPVDVAKIRRGPVRSFIEEEGRTRVVTRYVVAAPVSGRLLRLKVKERDPVAKGDLLAEIDPLALESRVASARGRLAGLAEQIEGVGRKRPKPEELAQSRLRAQAARDALEIARTEMREAEASRDKAKLEVDRAKKLDAGDVITESGLEDAVLDMTRAEERLKAKAILVRIREVELETAKLATAVLEESEHDVDWEEAFHRASLEGLKAELAVLEDDLARARILAPGAGVVLVLHRESETVVAAGAPILEVGDITRIQVEADLLSEDAARLRPGMKAEVFGRALGAGVARAKVLRVHPSAFKKISSLGVEQQRVTVVVAFGDAPPVLGDRYRLDVRIILDERESAVLVPESALFRLKGEWHVFAAVDGRAELRKVETGLRDGRVREVLEGLAEGEAVILHPNDALTDGARVEATERE